MKHNLPRRTTNNLCSLVILLTHFAAFAQTSWKDSVCKSLAIGTGTKVSTLKVDKNLTVSGNLIIGANGSINHTTRTISLAGNWTNSGAYSASGNKSTVTFSGIA